MISDPAESEPPRDLHQSLRERWRALAAQQQPQGTASAGAPLQATAGATPVAIRPVNAPAPAIAARAPRDRCAPSPPATASTSTVATPVLIAYTVSLVLGAVLAMLQTVVWITPLFEIATGITLGLALVPIRRHADGTDAILRRTTIGCVLLTFFIYLAVSCVINGASPIEFVAATTIGRRPTLAARSGVGFAVGALVFAASCGGAWYAARKTLDYSRDETLDRW